MNCLNPLRIRNKYNGIWMYVSCNKCEGCLSEKVVRNVYLLKNYINKFQNCIFVTLTYDNKHIPFVINGRPEIFRYDGNDLPEMLSCTDMPFNIGDSDKHKIENYPLDFAQGVLYYPDFQKFFKRFRKYIIKYYGRNKKWKYFLCTEYGPNTFRPHAHFCILSDSLTYNEVKDGVIKNWQLCDWYRLDENESFKVGMSGLSSYLSAYVNSLFSCSGFYEDKRIRPKTYRSKDIGFSVDNEMEEEIKRFFFRRFNQGRQFDLSEFFRYYNRKSKDSLSAISFDVFSTNFLSAYFSKPKGFNGLSSLSQYRRIVQIVRCYQTRSKIANILGYNIDLCSQDYLTWLSYRRFCKLLGLDMDSFGSVLTFADMFLDVRSLISSLNLKKQMQLYDDNNKLEYECELYNTQVDDLEKRDYRRLMRLGVSPKLLDILNRKIFSSRMCKRRDEFINLNKSYFLPKHLND